jgi:hypothetical protein
MPSVGAADPSALGKLALTFGGSLATIFSASTIDADVAVLLGHWAMAGSWV